MELAAEGPKKVHLISLGCARNRVDSEVMLGSLLGRGWQVCGEPNEADAVVINTCGFIGPAKEESVDAILSAASLKQMNPNLKVVVTGCLTQRYKGQLARGIPEVDFFIGTDEFPKIAEWLANPPERGAVFARRTHYIYSDAMPRVNTLAKYSAYLKVAEGCQHNCAFCIIPAIRGKLRSRPIASIVAEAEKLVEDGVMEINLIAQDLAAFGRDRGASELLPLLKELVKIPDLKWIRLLYMYPENISDEFLEFFASEAKLVKYLDIPIQHASDKILKTMNRGIDRAGLRAILRQVRTRIPGISIRTSVMVGFPGETNEDFAVLREFIEEQRIAHLGCFTFSPEEGTVAARLPDQIPEDTKQSRRHTIMDIQREISSKRLAAYVGQTLPVLIEGPSPESEFLWQGRLADQAPEVDGVVYINDGPVQAGCIAPVLISEAHDYDLVGSVLGSTH